MTGLAIILGAIVVGLVVRGMARHEARNGRTWPRNPRAPKPDWWDRPIDGVATGQSVGALESSPAEFVERDPRVARSSRINTKRPRVARGAAS